MFFELLLKGDRRSTDAGCLELDGYFDAVGYLNEGDAAVHPVLLPIEGHRSANRARTRAVSFHFEGELFGLRYPADGEVAVHLKSV